jgi:hypothetical protein
MTSLDLLSALDPSTRGFITPRVNEEVLHDRLFAMVVVSNGDRDPIQTFFPGGPLFPRRHPYWTDPNGLLHTPHRFLGQTLSLWAWPWCGIGISPRRLDRWEESVREVCKHAVIQGSIVDKYWIEMPAVPVLNIMRVRPKPSRPAKAFLSAPVTFMLEHRMSHRISCRLGTTGGNVILERPTAFLLAIDGIHVRPRQ